MLQYNNYKKGICMRTFIGIKQCAVIWKGNNCNTSDYSINQATGDQSLYCKDFHGQRNFFQIGLG